MGHWKSSTQTTYEQRVHLFSIWEKVGNASFACRQTGISRGTFNYWKGRFLAEGYVGLKAKTPRPARCKYEAVCPEKAPPAVQAEILAIKQQFPNWNIVRIARAANHAQPECDEISPSLVRMVLLQAELWSY